LLQQNTDVVKKTQGLVGFFASSFNNASTDLNSKDSFEEFTTVFNDMIDGDSKRVDVSASDELTSYLGKSFKSVATACSTATADSSASVLDSVLYARSSHNRRLLAAAANGASSATDPQGAERANSFTNTLGSFFDSSMGNKVDGEEVVYNKTNLDMRGGKKSKAALKTSRTISPSDPNSDGSSKFQLPASGMEAVLGSDENELIQFNSAKYTDNPFAGASTLGLTTPVAGLKLKSGNDNQEKVVAGLASPISVELPIQNFKTEMRLKKFACIFWNITINDWGDNDC
jgi:hypothetical protein